MTFRIGLVLSFALLNGSPAQAQPVLTFDANERIFVAHAFMNAAGFDGEWRDEGMHEIRQAVRERLADAGSDEFRKRMRRFRRSFNRGSWAGYAPYVLLTTGSPDFELDYDPLTTDDYLDNYASGHSELSRLLAEFYKVTPVDSLWTRYEHEIQELTARYGPYGEGALQDIVDYCRLDPDFYTSAGWQIHFTISPLMSYFTAQTVRVNGDIWLINSPSTGEPGPSMFYHEALHHVVDPAVDKVSNRVQKTASLFTAAGSKTKLGYDDWDSIVKESFVRTIDKVLQGRHRELSKGKVAEMVDDEYKLGFILAPSILRSLHHYERGDESLEDFVARTLAAIDIEEETKAWDVFWEEGK